MTIGQYLEVIRRKKPVVHHLTNWVTIYDCANIVKVFGGSPVMAHSIEEAAEMAGIASSLVLNIGTLTKEFVDSMLEAGKAAEKKGIPIILDVCGAGATSLRNRESQRILDTLNVSIIKGNASEIASVFGVDVNTRGVDSGAVEENPVEVAKGLADREHACVVITGKVDVLSNSGESCLLYGGNEIMANIVGTGCMAASVIGLFSAVSDDTLSAAIAALRCYETAASIAAEISNGPGAFKERLFDSVYNLKAEDVERKTRLKNVD